MGGFDRWAFQIRMHFGFVPFDEAFANALQRALVAGAPKWSSMARVSRIGRWTVSERFDAEKDGSLFDSIQANRPGGRRAKATVGVDQHNHPTETEVWLTGADRTASVRLEYLGTTTITYLQVETTRQEVDGEPTPDWIARVFRELCRELRPRRAVAATLGERMAGGRYGASGEVEWLTYLGQATTSASDVLRLRNVAGVEAEDVADGLLLRLDPSGDVRRLKSYWTKVKAVEPLIGRPAPDPPRRPAPATQPPVDAPAPLQLLPRPITTTRPDGSLHVQGGRYERLQVGSISMHTPGAVLEGFDLVRCSFDNVWIGSLRDGEAPVYVRNSRLTRCRGSVVPLQLAAIEDCLVDGYSGGFWATAAILLRHVIVRGNVDAVRILWPTFHRLRDRPSLARLHREWYATVDWAIDISEARFVRCDLEGIPPTLVRRDPATQAVVLSERVRHGGWLEAVEDHWWALTLERLADSERPGEVLIACPRGKRFEQEVRILNRLREAGIAEPD